MTPWRVDVQASWASQPAGRSRGTLQNRYVRITTLPTGDVAETARLRSICACETPPRGNEGQTVAIRRSLYRIQGGFLTIDAHRGLVRS